MSKASALAIVVAISTLHYSVMGYYGYDPTPEFETLMAWAFALMLALWCLDDAKQVNFHRPYEFGAFIFFTWPLVLPAYLIHTRGWRGIFIFMAFLILALLPYLSGWLAYFMSPTYAAYS
nr:hypothetical protein [uncultured Pseudomonas sp.]